MKQHQASKSPGEIWLELSPLQRDALAIFDREDFKRKAGVTTSAVNELCRLGLLERGTRKVTGLGGKVLIAGAIAGDEPSNVTTGSALEQAFLDNRKQDERS